VTVTAARASGVVRVEQIMGMPIVVDVRDADDAAALDPVFAWFREVDERFSTYRADSEISRLNAAELALGDAHEDVREVLERCEELRLETRGYFDVRARRADYVDPSGLVKGWSVDRAAAIADGLGWRNYAINAGGDMRLSGRPLPGTEWRVGIQHPIERMQLAAVVAVNDLAVATSGAYARGAHVFEPRMHKPAGEEVLSVTITGPELGTADAFATAAFAMGAAGPSWTARLGGYEAMTLMADGRSLRTPAFPVAEPN
jgi:thiamine biosynthesis lipoprotein